MRKLLTYEDENGEYKLRIDSDNIVTVKHLWEGRILFKKSYTTLENAKNALVKYCGDMPKQVKA